MIAQCAFPPRSINQFIKCPRFPLPPSEPNCPMSLSPGGVEDKTNREWFKQNVQIEDTLMTETLPSSPPPWIQDESL